MSDRRQFLKDLGVVFTGCALGGNLGRAQQKAAGRRRQVMVGGRIVKTIDMHAHVVIPEASAMMGVKIGPNDPSLSAGNRFTTMDEWGMDMQVLSINPTWYGTDRDLATKIVQVQNEKLAELCGKFPERFAAFASVALQFPDLAAQQLEDGVKKYNLRGAAISGHVGEDELSNPKFDPFWRKAEELGILVFMHPNPQGITEMQKRFAGQGGLVNVIGHPLETTIFLSHLIFDGTLDKFPGLKICGAHGGGYLPSYIARSDYGCVRFPEGCRVMKKKPSEYIRQLYFDSMVFTAEGLRHLVAECGASQIMIGTDYPFAWSTTTVDHVLNTPGLSDADKRAILGETAAKLLKISL